MNRRAAARVVQSLAGAASQLAAHARIGERLEQYQLREVRRILVGNYEMRYEVRGEDVVILRVWQALHPPRGTGTFPGKEKHPQRRSRRAP